jgi:mannose-6-phosphate isomerase-like protein (cupin superfamily)
MTMTYPGNTGEVSGRLMRAGDVEQLSRRSGSTTRFVAPGSFTGGQFGLYEWDMPANAGGASPHFHRTFSESFYITAGTVQLYDGKDWADAEKGDFLYVPPGGIHAFRNATDKPASMLILFAPGAPREDYFRETAQIAAAGRQLSYDEWTELFARHDQYRAE